MDLHTGTPFWPVRDGLPATYPALRQDAAADVAVLGAGITGALVAYELSRAGIDVIVVDRADVASGSTAASSGLLLYDTDASLADLARTIGDDGAARVYGRGLEAINRIDALCRALDRPCGFARRPCLYLASNRNHRRRLVDEFERRSRLGLDVRLLSADDVEDRYGFRSHGAIYSAGAGEIDPYCFTHELLAAALRAGARIFDRTAVGGVDTGPHGAVLRLENGCRVRAGHVVCATGYDVGVTLSQTPGRLVSTWAFVSEPLELFEKWPERCLIWETARPYLYVRSTDDGRLLAGGEDEPHPYRHRRRTTFAAKTSVLLERATALFPTLGIEPAYAWAGTFGSTNDGLPYIGTRADEPHVSFALGYGGNGITFGVIAATLLRDAILGRPSPDAELFGFDRGAASRRQMVLTS
jgi:glycine/D-amino acid oxidase-like deaminating enzyme